EDAATRYDYYHDGNGHANMVPTTIGQLKVDAAVTNINCFGQTTGAIQLTPSGLPGPYSYLWSDGETGKDRYALKVGTYKVKVTDVPTGKFAELTRTLTQNSRLQVLLKKSDNSIELVASGGVGPYAYTWDDGPTTAIRKDLAPGKYYCVVTDSLNCAAETVEVVIDPYRFYFSENPILLPLDAGDEYRADKTTKPNLSFLCEVWIELEYLSDVFVRIGAPIEQPADRDGRTEFEVQTLLQVYLQEHLPAVQESSFSRADSLFKRFYLQSCERYGTPPENAPFQVQKQQYVVLGGLDFYEYAANTWFTSYQAAAKPFLTWQPNNLLTLPEAPQYLYYLHNSFEVTEINAWVRTHFADGTQEVALLGVHDNVKRYEVYYLPAGCQQLNLGRYAKAILSWEVYVTGPAGEVLSEVRRYLVDARYFPNPRFFLYTNSLGGVDTLQVVGDGKYAVMPAQDEAARNPDPHYDPLQGDTLVLDRSLTPTLTVGSGALSTATAIGVQELLLSRRVTLQRDGFYWPGKIKSKATTIFDELETVPTLDFDFELPAQRRFTPRMAAGQTQPITAGDGGQP
ncbi:SprB repeat-containing protein, partial [Hymenobacter crusticola]